MFRNIEGKLQGYRSESFENDVFFRCRREANTFDSWDSCLVLDERNTRESIVVRFWLQKKRPEIVVWFWTKERSCSVLGTKKKARHSCLDLDERNTREHS